MDRSLRMEALIVGLVGSWLYLVNLDAVRHPVAILVLELPLASW